MAQRKLDPAALGPDFLPIRELWEGDGAPYPSEQSVRWTLRQLGPRLAADGGLGRHRGALYVHREKLQEAVRQRAIEQAARFYGDRK